jgi:hypothetical protein
MPRGNFVGVKFGIQRCEFSNATELNRRRQECIQRMDNDGRRRTAVLRVTTFSTFVSENSALAVELILSAHSQGGIGLTRCVDD